MTSQAKDDTSTFGWYIYGVVQRDAGLDTGIPGIGDPPSAVETVPSGSIAGLVGKIALDRPIGTTEDLLAHQRVLDDTAVHGPVLPVRFGAVVGSRQVIKSELLEPNEATFADALRELAGKVQYVLRARYDEAAVMREVIEENPAVLTLRGEIEGRPAEATHGVRLKLGQLVNEAVDSKRQSDTGTAVDLLAPVTVETSLRQPSHELDAAHVAVLVRQEREDDMLDALDDLAEMWRDRATIRLLGPMAPYDFVALPAPGAQPEQAL
jgi:hypothetical protein